MRIGSPCTDEDSRDVGEPVFVPLQRLAHPFPALGLPNSLWPVRDVDPDVIAAFSRHKTGCHDALDFGSVTVRPADEEIEVVGAHAFGDEVFESGEGGWDGDVQSVNGGHGL